MSAPKQILADPDRVNVYTCPKCRRYTVTIDLHKGVTPFLLGCRGYGEGVGAPVGRVKAICDGMAQSSCYPVFRPIPLHIPKPMYEWYTPDEEEYTTLDDPLREHVDKGVLLLRAINKEVKH